MNKNSMYQRKLTISQYIYNKILYDKELFSLHLSDNDFITKIIINTNEYVKYIKDDYEHLFNDFKMFEKKYIFVRETKNTLHKLENIENEINNDFASHIFSKIIRKYFSFPQYIREQILFFETYRKLKDRDEKSTLTFTLNNRYKSKFEARIYSILPGREEFYNYIICYGHKDNDIHNNKILSFKLSSIDNLIQSSKNPIKEIDDKIKEELEKKLAIPEFAGYENEFVTVEFDDKGLNDLKIFYKDRPTIFSKDKNKITFNCPNNQLINYLKQFGWHVYTDSQKINNELLKHHFKALVLFNNNNPDDFKNIVSNSIIEAFNEEINNFKNLLKSKTI